MADNKRASFRIKQRLPGIIKKVDSEETCDAMIEDLSALGIRLSIDQEDFVTEQDEIVISFNFFMLDDEEEVISVKGVVMKIFNKGAEGIPLGIKFKDSKENLKKIVEIWLTLFFEQNKYKL